MISLTHINISISISLYDLRLRSAAAILLINELLKHHNLILQQLALDYQILLLVVLFMADLLLHHPQGFNPLLVKALHTGVHVEGEGDKNIDTNDDTEVPKGDEVVSDVRVGHEHEHLHLHRMCRLYRATRLHGLPNPLLPVQARPLILADSPGSTR